MAGRDVEAGRAFVKLSIKEDLKALRTISKKLKKWGAGLGVAGAGIAAVGTSVLGAMAGMTQAFVTSGDELDKMSARTGVSVEQLSGLAHAAKLSGASLEDVETGMRFLAKKGIGADQLGAIADRFAALEDPTARMALAMELFGRSGTALIPMLSGGAAGLAAFNEEAERLGLVLSTKDATAAAALGDAMDKVKSAVRGVYLQVGAALAPALTEFAEEAAKAIGHIVKFVKENRAVIVTVAKVAAVVTLAGTALMAAGGFLAVLGMAAGGLATILSTVAAVIGAILSPIGLVVIAVAGAVAAFVAWTDAGQRMFGSLRTGFGDAAGMVRGTIGAIIDAIKAGNIELAGKIAWTGLKLAFFEVIDAIRRKWLEFSHWLFDSLLKMAERFAGGFPGLDEWAKQIGDFRGLVGEEYEADLKAGEERLNKLRNELATLRGRAETEAAYQEQASTPKPPQAPYVNTATSAGTFSAAAARIMFMGQGENYQRRTADATEYVAKRFKTMPKVSFVFEGTR